ncbi:MAG: AMP-binding protein, partial [Syntrophothermus sp.]
MYTKDFNKPAIIYNDKEYSYGEFLRNIQNFSGLLNINQGDRVAIFSENRPEWIFGFFAVWNSRGINVPIDFLSTPEEVAFIINDCRPAYIFTSSGNLESLKTALASVDYGPEVIVFDDVRVKGDVPAGNMEPADSDAVAVIIYTSGTTGSPKGVMLTYENLYSNVECITVKEGLIALTDRVIAILPFHHAFPLQGTILMPFYIGSTVVLPAAISSDEIIKTLQKYKITFMLG